MRKAIAWIVFSVLLFTVAVIRGCHSNDHAASTATSQVVVGEVPAVVLPPEQLPQFKNINIYTPPKRSPDLFINPPDDNEKPTEESKKIQVGVM